MTDHPPDGASLAVRARNLTRLFPSGVGVKDLDLDVEAGTIFGFIGPSGSGKTTTVRLLTGVLAPDEGELSVLGTRPVDFNRTERTCLGYMPQASVLYPDLSLWENLGFCASLFGMPWRGRRRRMEEMMTLVELTDAKGRLMRHASGGEQRRLALAATLVHDPELLLLDEPTTGIDPVLRRKFWDHFTSLRNEGRTLFITTQYVGEAAYCDRVGVLANGHLVTIDTPDGLRRQAFGGDVLDVSLASPISAIDLEQMVEATGASRSQRLSPTTVRLTVEDAGDVSPIISSWALDRGVEVESVDQFLPPFDDVFVELVSRLAPAPENGQ
jgi:ABC-2 type transport system ATP-binding protein